MCLTRLSFIKVELDLNNNKGGGSHFGTFNVLPLNVDFL